MKNRILSILLTIILSFSLVACSQSSDEKKDKNDKQTTELLDEDETTEAETVDEKTLELESMKKCIIDSTNMELVLDEYEMETAEISIIDTKIEEDSAKLKFDLLLSSEYVSGKIKMIAELSKWDSGWQFEDMYRDNNGEAVFTAIKIPDTLIVNEDQNGHRDYHLPKTRSETNRETLFCDSSENGSEELSGVEMNILSFTADYTTVDLEFIFSYVYDAFNTKFTIPATGEFDTTTGFWKISFETDEDGVLYSEITLNEEYIINNWSQYVADYGAREEILSVDVFNNNLELYIKEYYSTLGYGLQCRELTRTYRLVNTFDNYFYYDSEHWSYVFSGGWKIGFVADDIQSDSYYRLNSDAIFDEWEGYIRYADCPNCNEFRPGGWDYCLICGEIYH